MNGPELPAKVLAALLLDRVETMAKETILAMVPTAASAALAATGQDEAAAQAARAGCDMTTGGADNSRPHNLGCGRRRTDGSNVTAAP